MHLPPMFRDEKSWEYTDDRVLSTQAWNTYITNADRLGRLLKEDYGLQMVLHPHGDSHIETPDDIDRVFSATDPDYVGFCLDTGHIVYGGGDPVELCRTYPERISYVHIKAMDEALVKELYVVCEQDMYPCDPTAPLPNAIRTRKYLASIGLGLP